MSQAVLIIEDERVLARTMGKYLGQHGYEVLRAASGQEGLDALPTFLPDAVILDFNLPAGMDGLEVLKRIRMQDSGIKVIMVTGHGNVRVAVDAMKAGAFDYLSKPVILSELKLVLDRAMEQRRTEGQLHYFQDREASRGSLERIIGESPVIREMKAQVARIVEAARQLGGVPPPAVLIVGETGTGKELVARALHYGGPRAGGPFIELNVATIPAHLVESELFGYERGAFTDARERKLGLVEAAEGGTLFLDEIGELELSAQAKLLKLLEDRKVRRLGSVRDQAVDIQVVSATNRNLAQMVAEGRFREDLFYRLNTLQVQVPALRDRGRDSLLLARHVLAELAAKYGKPRLSLAAAAEAAILAHSWPGNVRELRNAIEQAVLYSSGSTLNDLALSSAPTSPGAGPDQAARAAHLPAAALPQPGTLDEVERALIARTLAEAGGNVSKAARRLGITRDRLRYRIDKYGLAPAD